MNLLSEKERLDFLAAVAKRKGCLYCWPTESNRYSGKDLKDATYKSVYDCSGLVTSSLYEATGGKIDRRATWNAQKLLQNCAIVDEPRPGDLAFYGPSSGLITHVMVYMGTKGKEVVMGASGGDSTTTTPEKAAERDAKVKGYRTAKYRGDFICFGRLVTNDD